MSSADHPLRKYQLDGVDFLLKNSGALLADEMGLGKTVQAITALQAILQQPNHSRALIVAPASLITNWKTELLRWAPDLPTRISAGDQEDRLALVQLPIPVLLMGYEQLRRDYLQLPKLDPFEVVVLDEAQRIKDSSSELNLACSFLPRSRSWALTATPVENRSEDVSGLFRFLVPGLITPWMDAVTIRARIAPHVLRRLKSEVAPELPPIISEDVKLELRAEQRKAYDAVWFSARSKLYDEQIDSTKGIMVVAAITRLKQICNRDEQSNTSCKYAVLRTIIASAAATNEKVIVFSQFVETLRWLSSSCVTRNSVFHGGLDLNQRDTITTEFRNSKGPYVLFMSYKAGGVGLNLQEADTVVLFDRWWNPATEEQAIHRAHRLGRTRPLHVLKFLVLDTVEERIEQVLDRKRDIFRQLFKTEPDKEAMLNLTTSELANILS
jgi:SNF2 family DNA or RNA helicase